jgi:CubicO group peptidase (beta-lactamase class C family)
VPLSFLESRRCAGEIDEPRPAGMRLAPADPTGVIRFGFAVAASADRLVATVSRDGGDLIGVEVFERRGTAWQTTAQLVPSDASDRDFGLRLAVAGDVVVVGSEEVAYVFERDAQGWRQTALLGPFDDAGDHAEIEGVATDGETIAVAASYPTNATLVFERPGGTWRQTQALQLGGDLGAPQSVALAGGLLVVGAPSSDACGTAHVYQRRGGAWQEAALLRGSGCPREVAFGTAVATSAGRILVGSDPGLDAPDRIHDGSAFLFERRDDAWQEVAHFTSCSRDLGRFGTALALSGDRALVGGPSYASGGFTGDVSVYARGPSGWTESGKISASDGAPSYDTSGFLALAGDTAFVGVPDRREVDAFDLGSVALLPPEACAPPPTPTPVPANRVWPLDGWRVEKAQDHGMSEVVLERARAYAFRPENHTQGVVIVRHGVIVGEWYEPGRDASSFAASWSVAKSFTSALVGIAIGEGLIDGTDVPMTTFVPGWQGSDKASMTLGDVLAMASGLDWTEDYSVFQKDLSDIAILASQTADQLDYVTRKDLGHPPGTTFNYSSGDTMLLSRVLEVATGMRAADYAQQALFGPIGMTPVEWWRDVPGHTLTYCCIDTPTRELAKFGLLYARGGLWGERQVVPTGWVRESTSAKVASVYGYQWWLDTDAFWPLAKDVFMARGFDGQYVYVSPSLDLVVVRSGHYDKFQGPAIADPNLFSRYPAAGLGNGLGTIPPGGWNDTEFFRTILESIVE